MRIMSTKSEDRSSEVCQRGCRARVVFVSTTAPRLIGVLPHCEKGPDVAISRNILELGTSRATVQ